MSASRMHADEVDTNIDLVVRLLAAQFSQWASLPVTPVPSAGTDNALFRLGTDKVVRLPRIDWAVGDVEKEQLLPKFAPFLPLAIPVPLAKGQPYTSYLIVYAHFVSSLVGAPHKSKLCQKSP